MLKLLRNSVCQNIQWSVVEIFADVKQIRIRFIGLFNYLRISSFFTFKHLYGTLQNSLIWLKINIIHGWKIL